MGLKLFLGNSFAESKRFELLIGFAYTHFPGVLLKPLGQLSKRGRNLQFLTHLSYFQFNQFDLFFN